MFEEEKESFKNDNFEVDEETSYNITFKRENSGFTEYYFVTSAEHYKNYLDSLDWLDKTDSKKEEEENDEIHKKYI